MIANVFLSNRNSQGFSLHYDSHDVFVLQLHGEKVWSLYDSPIELPTKSEAFGMTAVSAGPLERTVTLQPGDVLYIPRGYFHEARTTDTVSLHVTLGVHPYLWVDFLGDMLSRLGSEWAELRRSVSRNVMAASGEARVALIREMLSRMTERAAFGDLADDVYARALRHRLQSGPRPLRHHLAELVASHELTLHSRLSRRHPVAPVEMVREAHAIMVRWHGQSAAFHPSDAAMIEAPSAPDEKLHLVRRLVGIGLLVALPQPLADRPAEAA